MENRQEIERHLRKGQNNLVVIGYGVIAFGIWSVIKTVLYTALNTGTNMLSSEEETVSIVMFWIMMFVFLVFELSLRLYVGFSAVYEGRGRKKRFGYIILALLMALISFALVAANLAAFGSDESPGKTVVTIIVEASSSIMLIEMAIFAVRVKRLGRKLAEQEN